MFAIVFLFLTKVPTHKLLTCDVPCGVQLPEPTEKVAHYIIIWLSSSSWLLFSSPLSLDILIYVLVLAYSETSLQY